MSSSASPQSNVKQSESMMCHAFFVSELQGMADQGVERNAAQSLFRYRSYTACHSPYLCPVTCSSVDFKLGHLSGLCCDHRDISEKFFSHFRVEPWSHGDVERFRPLYKTIGSLRNRDPCWNIMFHLIEGRNDPFLIDITPQTYGLTA